MTRLGDADLDALEKLVAEATPGPWEDHGDSVGLFIEGRRSWTSICHVSDDGPQSHLPGEQQANARLIVALRNNAPALISEVRALRAALAKPVTGEEFSAAYLEMFALAYGDEDSAAMEIGQHQRGAMTCQILMRRRAAAFQPQPQPRPTLGGSSD